MTKGFKWSKFVTATTQKVLGEELKNYVIYGGNFFMELILPNALKITSFEKLRTRLDLYVKSHNGKIPEQITVNKRQYEEYNKLFPKYVSGGKGGSKITGLIYQGVPLVINK